MKDIKSLIDLIGNTPIVQAKNIDTGKCNLFLKMENMNPGSSIKDRVALQIINDAEKNGDLIKGCLLYTSPSPRDKRQSRMPSSA